MKSKILFAGLFCISALAAQETMFIHKNDLQTPGIPTSKTDSVSFSKDSEIMYLNIGGKSEQIAVSAIDSITFSDNIGDVYINYLGDRVAVINPLAFSGVDVSINGSYVTVNSTYEDAVVNYHISGNTENGNLKIYSSKKLNLKFDGVSITNPNGPAVNIQSGKNTYIELTDGKENFLSDGSAYSAPFINTDGEEEDQKATLFAEGDLKFSGNGSLTINANYANAHAIASDDKISISEGIIKATSLKDALHGKNGVEISGGEINLTSASDAIDGDEGHINITAGKIEINNSAEKANGIVCDSTINISGGEFIITLSGDKAKAIKAGCDVNLTGGNFNITSSGNTVLETSGSGYDPAYPVGIKSDMNVNIENAEIIINTKGKGGKGISADTRINIISGNIEITSSGNGEKYTNADKEADAYRSTCLTSDGNINIAGGTVTLSNTGSAGMGINSDANIIIGSETSSPTLSVTTTGSKITLSTGSTGGWGGPGKPGGNTGDYAEAKAIKADTAVSLISGNIKISSADDGIKAGNAVSISGGKTIISKSTEGIEAPNITISGGDTEVNASDDAINGTYGNGGESNDGSKINVSAGRLVLNSTSGDAMDSNGNLTISGGVVLAHGPASQPEVGVDVNGTFNVTGGFLIVSGIYSQQSQNAANSSTQITVAARTSRTLSASTLFHVEDSEGNTLFTFQPKRNYSMILFSMPELAKDTYKIYTGGSCSGDNQNGLFNGGEYTGGTLVKTFTISNTVSTVAW